MKANVIVFEAAVLIFSIPFFIGAERILGRSKNRAFLMGAVVFSLFIETAAVVGGMKNFYWYLQNDYYKHYPLGGYIIWFGLVPLAAVLLWYVVTVTAYMLANSLVPAGRTMAKAATAGAIAVGFYLIIEPVAVTNHWWTWNLKSFYIIDVPLLALVGMFLVVFTYATVYHHTVSELEDLPGPAGVFEQKSIKRLILKTNKTTKNLNFRQLEAVFLYRMVLVLPLLGALLAVAIFVLWLVANRGQIPPGW